MTAMVVELISFVVGLISIIILYFRHRYKYWAKKGVGYLEPKFPLGNSLGVLPTGLAIGVGSKIYYDALKQKGLKYGGIYLITEPHLVVTDPDYIRDILTKDFQHFVNRNIYANERDDPLSFHLFSAEGTKWKQLRAKLTPTFTSGKMKLMLQTVVDCSDNMINALRGHSGSDVEIKEFLCKFTTDVIGSIAFGIDCNSFEDPDAEFRKMGKRSFEFNLWMSMKAFLAINMPKLSLKLGLVVNHKDVTEFFTKSVRDVINHRTHSGTRRNDFLQILIDLYKEDDRKITFNEIVAQVFLFFIAGFDTSSTTMNFALYELSRNLVIQNKLRKEINVVLAKYDDKITYDSLNEMDYLDQIVNETLRKYPPVPTLERVCTKDYTLRETNIIIEEGTPVIISPYGLQMDQQHYPDPEKFDPSRFSNEEKAKRHPYVHLPFGEGPRNCIGLRFGLMQSKIGIISVIKNFRLALSSRTKPVTLDPHVFLLKSVDPIYVEIIGSNTVK